MQSFQILIERADFKKEDYHPGYYNKQLTGSGQWVILLFRRMQDARKWLPITLIGLDYYSQLSNILNEVWSRYLTCQMDTLQSFGAS